MCSKHEQLAYLKGLPTDAIEGAASPLRSCFATLSRRKQLAYLSELLTEATAGGEGCMTGREFQARPAAITWSRAAGKS